MVNYGENCVEILCVVLVIGNGSYLDVFFGNLECDVLVMIRILCLFGFDVINYENVICWGMFEVIWEFKECFGGGGVGLFYFVGYGFCVGNCIIFLLVDVDGCMFVCLLIVGIDFEIVLVGMVELCFGKLNLFVFDICLNNFFLIGDGFFLVLFV